METLGADLALALRHGRAGPWVVAFKGELGAGKTTLVRALLRNSGVDGAIRSPTYTLIEPYDLPKPRSHAAAGLPADEQNTTLQRVYHLDLYRLSSPGDVDGLGVRDLLSPDVLLLIEWPEKGGDRLPTVDVLVEICYARIGRCVTFTAHSSKGERLLGDLRPSLQAEFEEKR